jgi:uncharacterized sporulation protein YeaH/YhbH (DUF444 family)
MPPIIDRRLNPSGKNLQNRQKFLRRAKENIHRTVKKSVEEKGLKEIGKNEKVKIREKDLDEPSFNQDPNTGQHHRILPGNKTFNRGDEIEKPPEGSGSGREASDGPDGQDDFHFNLSRAEFLEYLFEDLELPDFVKESIATTTATKLAREGYTTTGSPATLNIGQSFKNSIGRRLALARPSDADIAALEHDIAELDARGMAAQADVLRAKLEELEARRKVVPFIDETDLRYNHWTRQPEPISQAVMFCLMDVSGSMGTHEKDISKRFFLLLFLFLERNYDNVEIRFIRHTTHADEVDEQTFFYDTLSGGTAISSGLELIKEIIYKEYDHKKVNFYIAQCTDGDNYERDNRKCEQIITDHLLDLVQYFAYIQVSAFDREDYALFSWYTAWPTYENLAAEHEKLVCKQITDQSQIWTVFRELFSK